MLIISWKKMSPETCIIIIIDEIGTNLGENPRMPVANEGL